MSGKKLLVIGAHAADFVWRSGGVIAAVVAAGGAVESVALSFGERGESGELWEIAGQTVDNVKTVREQEARAAAAVLGANLTCMDLGDYPLEVGRDALERMANIIRDFGPDIVITHAPRDPLNPDHPVAHAYAVKAVQLATGAGRASAFPTIRQPVVLMFEPHYPESSDFKPDLYVDVTGVHGRKAEAMAAITSQRYMPAYQTERSQQRGWQARRLSGDRSIEFAEVFQRFLPEVIHQL